MQDYILYLSSTPETFSSLKDLKLYLNKKKQLTGLLPRKLALHYQRLSGTYIVVLTIGDVGGETAFDTLKVLLLYPYLN